MKGGLIAVVCSLAFAFMLIPLNHPVLVPDELPADELSVDEAPVQGRSTSDHATGGYHLVSGEWWEKPVGYRPTVDDIDGDGILWPSDSHPMDPSMPPLFSSGSEGLLLRSGEPDWETDETDDYS